MSAIHLAQESFNLNPGLSLIGYGLGAIGPGVGVGLIFAAVINGTARQPEAQSKLMSIAWQTFVLVEVLALIGLVLFFIASTGGAPE
ncbi:MAG: ATP F0F1 synthase subunit C [Actinophytocola sp.]|uniref:ATP synthase subunit c n=1 Tax=Actinophytocola algeriensis TaxID=1768010 RepID=A0A7W7Q6K0_9PSEU|nr:ATP F0F1 synthase subunit C [Actinophytocola algeriensis]MBB4908016.1 F-type H+-transporting ATPase subunit c [Actinophytocola algeriensis]MBE1480046.1 F-type H+-transporting ATPase subunit c [Actinophytocola algeriensis]